MALANFEALHTAFCERAGMPAELSPQDEEDTLGFTVTARGVRLTFLEPGAERPGVALLIAELGPVPAHRELACWRTLMAINPALLVREDAVFSRPPQADEAVLHGVIRLDEATAYSVYEKAEQFLEWALQWREHQFLFRAMDLASQPGKPTFAQDALAFQELHRKTGLTLGEACGPLSMRDDVLFFELSVLGVQATMFRSARIRPADACLIVPMPVPAAELELNGLRIALAANFGSIKHTHTAAYGRNPVTGKLGLQIMFRLGETDAMQVLDHAAYAAQVAQAWPGCLVPGSSLQ